MEKRKPKSHAVRTVTTLSGATIGFAGAIILIAVTIVPDWLWLPVGVLVAILGGGVGETIGNMIEDRLRD